MLVLRLCLFTRSLEESVDLCWRVGGLEGGVGYLTVFGLRYLLERRPGILIGRPWDPDFFYMSWWWLFGLVVCVRRFFVGGGRFCGGWE